MGWSKELPEELAEDDEIDSEDEDEEEEDDDPIEATGSGPRGGGAAMEEEEKSRVPELLDAELDSEPAPAEAAGRVLSLPSEEDFMSAPETPAELSAELDSEDGSTPALPDAEEAGGGP